MSITAPKVILRIGSHAEKEYFEKLAKSLDGFMFGGNLLEITPAATTSLIYSLRAKRGGKPVPFYLDPMTYCYGPYMDPATGRVRTDLEALKSERLESRASKRKIKAVKESYTALAAQLGRHFEMAVSSGTAIDTSVIAPSQLDKLCEGVVRYQLERVSEIIADDELMEAAFGDDGTPAAVFAPYFFVHEKWATKGLATTVDLIARTVALRASSPVHGVVCASASILLSAAHVQYIIDSVAKTKAAGVWLWFDGFDELDASGAQIAAFRKIVKALGRQMKVYNLHGGYFSLLLAHDGLTGISHGVGYGERKPVAQVIGAAAPNVRYYLPAIKKRVGVPDIQRCFGEVGVTCAADFHDKVCNCVICKGALGKGLKGFAMFGEMHRAKPTAARDSQTPAAAKMCRYHFLINRFSERAVVAALAASDRSEHLRELASEWRDCYSLRSHLGDPDSDGYLELWADVLT